MNLNLPLHPVSDRFSITTELPQGQRTTIARFDGPGCLRHIWMTQDGYKDSNRLCIIRIFFDDATVPHVESPLGDFFGVMHGMLWYPINPPHLSVQSTSGYICFFPMPFAQSARIEIETADRPCTTFLICDWHRYPGQVMAEPKRFSCRWRRDTLTRRYSDGFLLLDAEGPGQLLGFVYGVILKDNTDRWSHGGSDNIYIDGQGAHPAYLRGIGGEDTFGTSYGGAKHDPETHLHAGMPLYYHRDTGEARPAQVLTGYRFFDMDPICFQESIHLRFGCMENDICATAYWYQEGPLRPYTRMPSPEYRVHHPQNKWAKLPQEKACDLDLALPESGAWLLCGPFGNSDEWAMAEVLTAERELDPSKDYDGGHEGGSPWLSEGSRSLGRDRARWVEKQSYRGFIDFNHVFQPQIFGVAVTHRGVALAVCDLHLGGDAKVRIRLVWSDRLQLCVDDLDAIDMGDHSAFRPGEIEMELKKGRHRICVKQSNTRGSNHGGWVFCFQAQTGSGERLIPQLPL
ncbi:MAG: DUF2961 domain-containing protein [Planctomycetes bacterium]|nr:DUF2961 domain-containing protein [Planctomycetota bacterium]